MAGGGKHRPQRAFLWNTCRGGRIRTTGVLISKNIKPHGVRLSHQSIYIFTRIKKLVKMLGFELAVSPVSFFDAASQVAVMV